MGNEVDAHLAALGQIRNAVDGQARAVDCDGAFGRQEACPGLRGQHTQLPALTYLREVGHLADTVHMARHQMPAQAVIGAQGFFQVDGATLIQPGRLVQRLGGNVHGEGVACRVHASHCHAGAVEGDAIAQTHIVQVASGWDHAQPLAVGGRFAQGLHGGNMPRAGDDSSKHGVDCGRLFDQNRSRPLTRASTRRSGPTACTAPNSRGMPWARSANGARSAMPRPGPSRVGARYSNNSSTSPASSKAPLSVCPASTCSSFTPRRARSCKTAFRFTRPSAPGSSATAAPRASRVWRRVAKAERPASVSNWPAAYIQQARPAIKKGASGGVCKWLSSTTTWGWRGVDTARTSSRGWSASTVPTPVNTAHARARQACPSARAASDVIHWLAPLCSAVVPSSDAATLSRTQGVPRTMRLKKPRLSSRDCAAPWPTSTVTPAARSRAKPWPATRGLGSSRLAMTLPMPAAISASQHGPVRPW